MPGFDVAGVGNVIRGAGLRPIAKAVESSPDPTVGAPALDPTKKLVADLSLDNQILKEVSSGNF